MDMVVKNGIFLGKWAMDDQAKVFVVNDGDDVGDDVCLLVQKMGLDCERFASGEDFLRSYDSSRPGCVVLDIRMSGMSGLQMQKRLNGNGTSLPVIFVSAVRDLPTAVQVMRSGAVNFLQHPFREQELWDTICEAIAVDRQRREEQAARADRSNRMASLSSQERQVMDMVVDGRPNKAIASKLGFSVRTIEIRRARVMQKLGVRSLSGLIRFALNAANGTPVADRAWAPHDLHAQASSIEVVENEVL